MLFKNIENSPQKITTDYRAVLNRLQKSIAVYAVASPEVIAVKHEIDLIYFNIFLTDAHLNHLQKICKLLERKKTETPLISLIHEGFCTDLELFKRGATITSDSDIYS